MKLEIEKIRTNDQRPKGDKLEIRFWFSAFWK